MTNREGCTVRIPQILAAERQIQRGERFGLRLKVRKVIMIGQIVVRKIQIPQR